jgi:hypothetical protein
MKFCPISFVLLAMATVAVANTPPTVVIQSAVMRPGTTLMDVVYRVNDPDDAMVKTRALAFVNGVRSFAKVLKPVTFVEGTAAKLGDAIPSNTEHTLTWNVAADWNVDLGQVKFEVLAMDQRGLLPFDWITIPAAGGKPAITISEDVPTDAQVLNAYFWQYATGDTGLSLTRGELSGTAASGVFNNVELVKDTIVKTTGVPYIFKRMNLAPADTTEMNHATMVARAGLLNANNNFWEPMNWHAVNRPYDGVSLVIGWGMNTSRQLTMPAGLNGVTAITAAQDYSLALKSDGTVVGWGNSNLPPDGLSGITMIAAGDSHSLALKSDGKVVAWGDDSYGETDVPAGLSGVTAIAAGTQHSLALKSNGTVVAWGLNDMGQATVPASLTGVIAIAAGRYHSLALKSNRTVVTWGFIGSNFPAGLSGVTAIAAHNTQSLALKSDGTVVQCEDNYGSIPAGLSGVVAISAGNGHSLALKNDGTVVAWGLNDAGQTAIPAGLSGVTAIAAGDFHNIVIKGKAP